MEIQYIVGSPTSVPSPRKTSTILKLDYGSIFSNKEKKNIAQRSTLLINNSFKCFSFMCWWKKNPTTNSRFNVWIYLFHKELFQAFKHFICGTTVPEGFVNTEPPPPPAPYCSKYCTYNMGDGWRLICTLRTWANMKFYLHIKNDATAVLSLGIAASPAVHYSFLPLTPAN